MPHLIVEYNSGLEQQIQIQNLTSKLHKLLAQQRSFQVSAIKSRAKAYDYFVLGSNKNFIHIQIRILEGREVKDVESALKAIGEYTKLNTPEEVEVTAEVVEMQKTHYFTSIKT